MGGVLPFVLLLLLLLLLLEGEENDDEEAVNDKPPNSKSANFAFSPLSTRKLNDFISRCIIAVPNPCITANPLLLLLLLYIYIYYFINIIKKQQYKEYSVINYINKHRR